MLYATRPSVTPKSCNRRNEAHTHSHSGALASDREEQKCTYKMFTLLDWQLPPLLLLLFFCFLLLFLFVDDSQHVPRLFVDLLFFTCSSPLNETFLFHFFARIVHFSPSLKTIDFVFRLIFQRICRRLPAKSLRSMRTISHREINFIYFSAVFFSVCFSKSIIHYIHSKWR